MKLQEVMFISFITWFKSVASIDCKLTVNYPELLHYSFRKSFFSYIIVTCIFKEPLISKTLGLHVSAAQNYKNFEKSGISIVIPISDAINLCYPHTYNVFCYHYAQK